MVVIPRPLPSFPEGQCGNETMYSIPKASLATIACETAGFYSIIQEATSFELRAEAVGQIPQFGPVMGIRCSYILRVTLTTHTLHYTLFTQVKHSFKFEFFFLFSSSLYQQV